MLLPQPDGPITETNSPARISKSSGFSVSTSPYIHVDGASFVISYCHFPAATASFEPCHGTAGIKSGVVHGASDRIGARPSSNPVTPADVIATIYECLGIPADLELRDRLNRPFQLVPWGTPIREVLV